VPINFEIPL